MAAEARRAYMDFMNGSGSSNANAQQQQQQQQFQQQQQGQWQPGSNLHNQYAAYAAHLQQQQGSQGIQNPYAGQQYHGVNPVSTPNLSFDLPYTYPVDLSNVITTLVPARPADKHQFARATVPPAAPTPPPAVPPLAPASSAALSQHGQLQPYIAQGPPQPIPQHARAQCYVDLPRNYNPPPQSSLAGYYPEWQHSQNRQQNDRFGYNVAPEMAPTQPETVAYQTRDWSYESIRDRDHDRVRYSGVWPPPDVVRIPSPPAPANTVIPPDAPPPLALCHVCSVCGQMRSNGYHRSHPIIPGQILRSTPCRRCRKKARLEKEKKQREKEAKDAKEPSRKITIEIHDDDNRGRARTRPQEREDSPPRYVYRTFGRYRTAREVSPERSPPSALRRRTRSELRVSSTSPVREGVRYYYRRNDEYEYSPEPDARTRLNSHPAPFRSVTPGFPPPPGAYPEEAPSPPPAPRGILKKPPPESYTVYTTYQVNASTESMEPEVGASRVQFVSESKPPEHTRVYQEDDYVYRRRSRQHFQRGHVEELPHSPEPPVQHFEKLVVREESPPRQYIRDQSHARRRESDEHHVTYVYKEDRPPPEDRSRPREASHLLRTSRNLQELDEKLRRAYSRSPPPLPPPPPTRKTKDDDPDDGTDSDSEASVEHSWVKYRGLDENGQPATFMERRSVRKVPEQAPASPAERPRVHFPPGPTHRGFAAEPAVTRGFCAGYRD